MKHLITLATFGCLAATLDANIVAYQSFKQTDTLTTAVDGQPATAGAAVGFSGNWTKDTGQTLTYQTNSIGLGGQTGADDRVQRSIDSAGVGYTNVGARASLAAAINTTDPQTYYFSCVIFSNRTNLPSQVGFQLQNGTSMVVRVSINSAYTFWSAQVNGGTQVLGPAFANNTTCLVVGKLTLGATDTVEVNVYTGNYADVPASEPASWALTASSTTNSLSIDSVRFYANISNLGTATGVVAWDEFRLGTSYADVVPAAAPPALVVPVLVGQVIPGGDYQISCPSQTGYRYSLWVSSDMVDWFDTTDFQDGTGSNLTFTAGGAAPGSPVFYRIDVAPVP